MTPGLSKDIRCHVWEGHSTPCVGMYRLIYPLHHPQGQHSHKTNKANFTRTENFAHQAGLAITCAYLSTCPVKPSISRRGTLCSWIWVTVATPSHQPPTWQSISTTSAQHHTWNFYYSNVLSTNGTFHQICSQNFPSQIKLMASLLGNYHIIKAFSDFSQLVHKGFEFLCCLTMPGLSKDSRHHTQQLHLQSMVMSITIQYYYHFHCITLSQFRYMYLRMKLQRSKKTILCISRCKLSC